MWIALCMGNRACNCWYLPLPINSLKDDDEDNDIKSNVWWGGEWKMILCKDNHGKDEGQSETNDREDIYI